MPTYEMVDEAAPDHSKSFHVAAHVGSRAYAPAWGRNKKEAEQRAASNALTEPRARSPSMKPRTVDEFVEPLAMRVLIRKDERR
jgi:dsRNA-specific ribonuclease